MAGYSHCRHDQYLGSSTGRFVQPLAWPFCDVGRLELHASHQWLRGAAAGHHVGMNILLATGFWFWGPWDLGAMDLPLLISFAALAIISFAVAFYSARSVKAQR